MPARLVLRRSSLAQFFTPLIFYLAGCLACLVVAYALGDVWMPSLFLTGCVAVLLAWRGIQWPDKWSRYLSFGAVLLLICAVERGFYVADYFVNGTQFDAWPFQVLSPQTAVFKGEIVAIIGTLLVVLAWRTCGGARVSPVLVMEQPRQIYRVATIIYAFSLASMLVTALAAGIAASLGQLLPTLLGMGLVSAFLLSMALFRRDGGRLIAVLTLSAPFALLASGSGMKESMLLALVPSAVMAWRYFRSPFLRVSMIVIAVAGLGLVTAYVNFYRDEVWVRVNRGLPPSQMVPQDFMRKLNTEGFPYVVGNGVAAFFERSDASYLHGWAVSIADEQAFHPELVFAPLTYVFVPRMLWPEKPSIQTGLEYSSLVFGEDYLQWSTSSTAAGFYPSLYLGAGWPAVFGGSLLAGALLAAMTRLVLRFGGAQTASLYVFSMLPSMLRMDENWADGVLSRPVLGAFYVMAIVALAKVFASVVFHARRAPGTWE